MRMTSGKGVVVIVALRPHLMERALALAKLAFGVRPGVPVMTVFAASRFVQLIGATRNVVATHGAAEGIHFFYPYDSHHVARRHNLRRRFSVLATTNQVRHALLHGLCVSTSSR